MIRVFAVFLNILFLSLPAVAHDGKLENLSAQDMLIKSEVETAVSMLQAIFTKYQQGEMNLVQAKKLGADLLRELKYGTEGYFWADTLEGVLVAHHFRRDAEGKNRLKAKDKQGTFYIREILAKGKAGGGYVEYWFPKKEQTAPQPKRSYVLLFKPFGWVVGSGYYRDIKTQDKAPIELKQFVERGADLIAKKGEKVFDAFRQKESEWFKGERYILVWDMEGMRYVYPPRM